MKMGLWLVLAVFHIFAQAQMSQKVLVTAIEPKEVTSPASDGDGFSTDLSWVEVGLPSTSWALRGWVFVTAAADNARLMQVRTSADQDVYFFWPTNGPPTLNDGNVDNPATGSPNRENGMWLHLLMGCYVDMLFAVVTLRGSVSHIEINLPMKVEVKVASLMMGPVGDTTFTVKIT